MSRIFSLVSVLALLFGFAACASETASSLEDFSTESEMEESGLESADPPLSNSGANEMRKTLTVTVNGKIFAARLYENETAQAFAALLPLTLDMSAMPHEKYYYLPHRLPSSAQRVQRIQEGEIMLWGSDCLVLFYESFSTSYSYTPVGRIENCEGLVQALGSGGAAISFALEN